MTTTTTTTVPEKTTGSPTSVMYAQQPMGTALCNSIACFFSPVSWWRTAVFKRVDLRPLWISCVSMVLPPVILALYCSVSGDKNRSTRSSSTTGVRSYASAIQSFLLVPALWLTPWTAAFAWKASASLQQLWRSRKEWISMKARTKESAWECLAKEVTCGRAYRCRGYDIYTPTTTTTTTTYDGNNSIKRPILFFPGATVEHSAYAPVAARFAQAGYLVVVVSAEPLRIVDEWLLPPRYIRRICSAVERRHDCGSDWVLMGHSMGSFLCTKLARPLNAKQIVLWGCGACVAICLFFASFLSLIDCGPLMLTHYYALCCCFSSTSRFYK